MSSFLPEVLFLLEQGSESKEVNTKIFIGSQCHTKVFIVFNVGDIQS